MGFFDDILVKTAITDEADRAALAALVEKNPTLKTLVDERSTAAETWEIWRADNWDPKLGLTKREAQAISEAEQAKLRVQALEAAGLGGNEVPFKFEDIEPDLQKRGYVKADDALKAINQSATNMENFFKRTFTLPAEYMKEFGDAPPPDLLEKMLADYGPKIKVNPLANPRDSYDAIVASKRAELSATKAAADKAAQEQAIKDAEERGAARARQEIGMAPGAAGMPVDDFGTPSLNARQNRIDAADKAGKTMEKSILERPLGSTAADGLRWIQEQRNVSHSVQ